MESLIYQYIISNKEYGGTQDVFIQKCKVLGRQAYIVRAEKTEHTSNVIEIVSDIKFRDTYNLKDKDIIKIFISEEKD